MRISNTYLDVDKDVWCKLGMDVFFVTHSIYIAPRSAGNKFNSWIDGGFTKVKIGTKHD